MLSALQMSFSSSTTRMFALCIAALPLFLLYGQDDREGRAFSRFTLHLDVALEPLHDIVAHREAEARAFAGLFGRIKGIKNLFEVLFRDAYSGIREFHEDGITPLVIRSPPRG